MKKKKGLRGNKIWIINDLTWRQMRSRWKFKEAVRAKERGDKNMNRKQ